MPMIPCGTTKSFFRRLKKSFFELLENYLPQHTTARELLQTELDNLPLYGYGIKAFMLSMIETAMRVTNKTIPNEAIETIIGYGKEMLNHPVQVMEGTEDVLTKLKNKYRLVMATKGDLLDQERKLKKSGLEKYFHHIEIMSEKKTADYQKLIKHLDVMPQDFAMIGNSLKSDVLPVLELGGYGFHIPYHVTWAHERVETEITNQRFKKLNSISEILNHLPL